MTSGLREASQNQAARAAGLIYLLTNASAISAQYYIRSRLIADGNAATTAANIMASERLFRLGIVLELFTFAAVIALAVALYALLRPVHRGLALLALSWRLVENAALAVMTFTSLNALQLLTPDPNLRPLAADRLQALALLSVWAHDDQYTTGLIFFGLGSAVFCYLFFKSRYIPRALAAWGVFASLLTAASSLVFLLFPHAALWAAPGCYLPIMTFEVITGFWLLVKGVDIKALSGPPVPGGSGTAIRQA
jgi:hypothetical protein